MITAPAVTSFEALGTTVTLLLSRSGRLEDARSILAGEVEAIDRAASRFRSDSEIVRLNRAEGGWTRVSPLLFSAIEAALWAARVTDGNVDPTVGEALRLCGYDRDFASLVDSGSAPEISVTPVPGWQVVETRSGDRSVRVPPGVEIDLGATAKAFIVDMAAARIHEALNEGVLVSIGGDMAAAGPAPAEGWRVLVTDDHRTPPDSPGHTVAIHGGGLATSSTTVRTWTRGGQAMHHIIDPESGLPADSCWRTASVAAVSCLHANVAATAAIVRGEAAPAWLERWSLPARLVGVDGRVVNVGSWPEATP